jgi:uncharacterized protein YdhG (YjbR/CyaY superfamily)
VLTAMTDRLKPESIDDYIADFSAEIQSILETIRFIVREEAPDAKEIISHDIPAFTLNGDLIYFAAFNRHIAIYPPVMGDDKLSKELAPFRGEKGNLRFPLDHPIPYALIRRVVKARIKEYNEQIASGPGRN